MNVLILDNTDDNLLQMVNEHKETRVITGTIRRPRLYPLPDLIIVNFDDVFGSNKKETVLMELSRKLHPQVTIIAVSTKWDDGLKMFAKLFGVDECCNADDLNIIRMIIDIIASSHKI
ncbi:MAG: hypothetical protein IJH07_06730 [Ruminococcus sp.]|nr:hypothetical protein [Ruminococcus sp.]